jgi:hypothetical protein
VGGDEPHLRRHRRANHPPLCRGRPQAILRPPRCQGDSACVSASGFSSPVDPHSEFIRRIWRPLIFLMLSIYTQMVLTFL